MKHKLISRLGVLCVCLFALVATPTHAAPKSAAIDIRPVAKADPGSRLPPDWHHGAFMEIFVRGYKDSNGDGIGDLRGLIQSLDYLQGLGIKGLWLMPVTESFDKDHGYATTNFRAIEPDYGTLADFDELLRQAHARGMGVIVDYVPNHSSSKHPMFENSEAGGKFRDWYVWTRPTPTGWDIWGKDPWVTRPSGAYFGTFNRYLPDFNLRNPKVVDYHLSSLRFWLNRGLDGYRFDAVPHLIENNAKDWNDQPESRALTLRFQEATKAYTNRFTVCEATASPELYAAPQVCGSAFAFAAQSQLVKASGGDAKAIAALSSYYTTAPPSMSNFASNHDIFAGKRLWDQLEGNEARYRLVAASYLLLPGTPFIYYGEEVGQAGAKNLKEDDPLRAPMSWSPDSTHAGFSTVQPYRPIAPNAATHNAAVQQATQGSLYHFYKDMIGLRNRLPAIARGSYEHPSVDALAWTFQRVQGDQRVLVAIQYGARSDGQADMAPTLVANLPPGQVLVPLYPQAAQSVVVDANGNAILNLPAQSVSVFLLSKP